MEVANATQQKHFVLVHGAGHGAWCWYKLKSLLESSRHKVTAIDLATSGVNPKRLDEVDTLQDYCLPLLELMAAIPQDDKVIVVGHSYGGFCIALAMDLYPKKISIGVFIGSIMPDSTHPPIYFFNQYYEWNPDGDDSPDTKVETYGCPDQPRTVIHFGPIYLSTKLYQNCTSEEIELAKVLVRPVTLFSEDLSKLKAFSEEGYGSVKRGYIICSEDKAFPVGLQHWLVDNVGVSEVKEIKGADHMPMISKPQELCQCLVEIAEKVV
uniref:Norfluorocurarine synthase 2 n=1 Tax=Strychnos nux-vomica TaxID=28545 RepID=NS2_STRNX|nr:norfluorocurarine synthase 2 [Strychnos nux-vomica]